MASPSFEEIGAGAMRGLEILAQVDDFHRRERPVFHARIQLQKMVFPRPRILKTFQRRRRRTEQRDRPFEFRAHDGHIPAVIARRFFLLVARLLLLIDDDQPQIFDRRENGRARSHHDARLAAPHAPPFARAFHFRQRAVQHRDARAESRPEQSSAPKRQRDLRNQNQRGLVPRERRFDGAEIHFRFPAAGDAVEKSRGKNARIDPAANDSQFPFLIRIQNIGRRRVIGIEQIFFDGERLFPAFQFFLPDHPFDERPRNLGEFCELRQRQRAAFLRKNVKDARFFFGKRSAALRPWLNCSEVSRVPRDNFLHARLAPHRDFARFELLAPLQALRRRFPAGQLAQAVRAHRPALDFHQRKQRQLRDFGFAAIPRRVEFGAARAPRIGHQKFALVPQIDLWRQHRAKNFSQRRHVVAAHPAPQLHKFRRQRRNRHRALRQFP